MDAIRGAMALIVTICILVLLLGFFGGAHPALDTLGALRLQFAVGFIILAIISTALQARIAGALSVAGVLIVVLGIAPFVLETSTGEERNVRGYQHNIRFENADVDGIAVAIRAYDADFATLQEVTDTNRRVLEVLSSDYPHQIYCQFSETGGVAIVSRSAFRDEPGCERGKGFAWATLDLGDKRFLSVANIHLAWPWPRGQQDHVTSLLPKLREIADQKVGGQLDIPLVIAGDFNMAPWGSSVKRIEEAARARLAPGFRLTYKDPIVWPGLPLDHAMTTVQISAEIERLDRVGSDHHALGIQISMP